MLFIESWLKKGFDDGELNCSSMIKEVVFALAGSKTVSETMEAKAREIADLLEDPDYVRRNRSSVDVDVTLTDVFRSAFACQRNVAHYDANPLHGPQG